MSLRHQPSTIIILALTLIAVTACDATTSSNPDPLPTLFVIPTLPPNQALGDQVDPGLEPDIVESDEAESEQFSEQANLYLAGAEAAFEVGDYQNAIDQYTLAINEGMETHTIYNNRGLAHSKLFEFALAIADYTEALVIDPEQAVTYRNRGIEYIILGENDLALADFDQALVLDPNFVHAYLSRGKLYYSIADYGVALADFDQAIALDPQNANAYNERANTYAVGFNNDDQAIADYTRAIELDPTFALAYYNRAFSYELIGETQNAIDDLTTFLELWPSDDEFAADARARIEDLGGVGP